MELETEILVGERLGYSPPAVNEELLAVCTEVRRLVYRLRQSLAG